MKTMKIYDPYNFVSIIYLLSELRKPYLFRIIITALEIINAI